MRRCGVQIIIELFHILPMISLMSCDSEEALFKDGIFTVPEAQSKAKTLVIVGYSSYAVFTPSICP